MRLLEPGATLGYKGSRLQQLSMDIVEGQSLKLHIGRLGKGGFAAQMGLGRRVSNEGGDDMRGVRRRCSFVNPSQFLRTREQLS